MCRILYVKSKTPFETQPFLHSFAEMAKNSKEYQGHGWGCACWDENAWKIYRNIVPVWEDDLSQFGRTSLLLVHARSAFRDQGITIENNMPFVRDDLVFVFNGELHGVRLKERGRIGAEKIFNFILRFYKGDLLQAVQKGTRIIENRSEYIRAMNFILASADKAVVFSLFNEDAPYFTMHCYRDEQKTVVCSEPLSLFENWQPINNRTVGEL
ncbi:MAG: hypothetical protein GXO77_05640 [Calditrichaeota bacterium]|nr:hypothetical protein [Calditrichota bacterium]